MDPINLTKERAALLISKARTNSFQSIPFRFIEDHFGLRRGQRHMLLGTTGQGKSTLSRSVLLQYAKHHRVLLYSTEEDKEATETAFAEAGAIGELSSNVSFVYEKELLQEIKKNQAESWKNIMLAKIKDSKSEILFFDNLTTSSFYDGQDKYSQTSDFQSCLESVFEEAKIPCFVVAHTRAGIKNDQLASIEADDVRGPKNNANKVQYLYTIQVIRGQTKGLSVPTYAVVKVIKARGVGNKNGIYLLDFDHEKRQYTGDARITHMELAEIFKNREKLK